MSDLNQKISDVVKTTKPSGIRAFFELVLGVPDVISLGVGEPDFVTPWRFRESAIYSLEKGYTRYTSNYGLLELREVIADYTQKIGGPSYDPKKEILIAVGVSEAMDLAIRAVTNPGDEIIYHEPCFVSYEPVIRFAGGVPVAVSTPAEDGFRVRPEAIASAVTKKTKAILLNYPCNPTGASLTRETLGEIAEIAEKHDLIVITDEIYDRLSYDEEHTVMASLPGMKERLIYLNGFSKAYAMTGWRVGYACAPAPLLEAMMKVHQYTMMCASIMGQMAAIEALKNGWDEMQKMVRSYNQRRRLIVERFNQMGLECHLPEGAFYAFPSIRSTGLTSQEFSVRLLKEEKVAVVPGDAFGPTGEGHIRCAYATGMEDLREALARMAAFVDRLKKV